MSRTALFDLSAAPTPTMAVAAMIDTLGLPTSPDLDRFIDAEITAERVRYSHHEREVARCSGVHFGGMEADTFRLRGLDEIVKAAVARKARSDAWAASPEGRFHRAACLIARATGDERLLQCATRGVTGEMDRAARLLAPMDGPAADDARAALADLVKAVA